MLKNIKVMLQYDGSEFSGWQRLKTQLERKSVQGTLEDTLTKILSEPVKVIGSGRTDKGVHALGQTANFYTLSSISTAELQRLLNEELPDAIRVLAVTYADENFHSRYSAKTKTYEYCIDRNEKACVFTRKYTCHHPEYLDVIQMRKAAGYFIGIHDFKAFSTFRKDCLDTVREIFHIQITELIERKSSNASNNHVIVIEIKGNGFLYNMVRIIVGTLIEVGEGKKKAEDIKDILENLERKRAGKTAEYQGLSLKFVEYK